MYFFIEFTFYFFSCKVVYHHGFTCDVYQGSKKDPDYSFKVSFCNEILKLLAKDLSGYMLTFKFR